MIFNKKKRLKTLPFSKPIIISFSVFLISVFALFLMFFSPKITAFASLLSQAGYVSEITLVSPSIDTNRWHGLYGIALRVPGYNETMQSNISSGDITRKYLFFDCIEYGQTGGNELYASTSPSIDFDSLEPATSAEVDNFLNCSSDFDCADNTFKNTMSIYLGENQITNIPSTNTYRWDGQNDIFNLGILKDSSDNLIYVTNIKSTQEGYRDDILVNYQMLIPVPANQSKNYYFFTDPNDECPESGFGNTVYARIYGYIKNPVSNPVSGAEVIFAGVSNTTDSSGYYSITAEVVPRNYSLIVFHDSYKDFYTEVEINFSDYIIEKNISLEYYSSCDNCLINPTVEGYVKNSGGNFVSGVKVMLGNDTAYTDSNGYYQLKPSIVPEPHLIVAIKSAYHTYSRILDFDKNTDYLNHNITLDSISPNYPSGSDDSGTSIPSTPSNQFSSLIGAGSKKGEKYWISSEEITITVQKGKFAEYSLGFYGIESNLIFNFQISENLYNLVSLDKKSVILPVKTHGELKLTAFGNNSIGTYTGYLNITGTYNKKIPLTIKIVNQSIKYFTLDAEIDESLLIPSDPLKYKIKLINNIKNINYPVNLNISIISQSGKNILSFNNTVNLNESLTIEDFINFPDNMAPGTYFLKIQGKYKNYIQEKSIPFEIVDPIYLKTFLGIPLWLMFLLIAIISLIFLIFFIYKEKQKELKPFHFYSGEIAKNLSEFKKILPKISEDTFKHHVNSTKNDFAEWIKQISLKKSEQIQKLKTKEEIIKYLK